MAAIRMAMTMGPDLTLEESSVEQFGTGLRGKLLARGDN
jgi:hypothetical protein